MKAALITLCSLALLARAVPAAASSAQVPGAFIDRPLTLPAAVMRLDGGPRWPDYDATFKHIVNEGGPDQDYLNPGLSFGLTDDFELGLVYPIELSPDTTLHDPRIYILYQLDPGTTSYGIFVQARLGFHQRHSITAGVPLYHRLAQSVRLETGGFAQIDGIGDDSRLNLLAPVYFSFQISNRFYAGPEAGLGLYGIFDDGSGIATPIGGFLGYTLGAGGRPLGDLYGRVRLTDVPDGALELMFGIEFFFDL
jgi:hypothetical protein